MPLGMARSKAHANLPTLSPMLYDTLGPLALLPDRELATPADCTAAWPGVDRLRIDATERASHRSADEAQQREHYRGKKPAYAEEDGHVAPEQVYRLSGADVERSQARLPHVETRVSA